MATFAGKQSELVDALNSIIELDYDAIEAYQAAIERIEDMTAKQSLTSFMEDHVRHTVDVAAAVTRVGGVAKDKGDIKAVLTKGKVVLAGLVGDKAILQAMKTNEDDTNRAYENIVERDDLDEDLRLLLNKNLDDERRHRAWIEAELSKPEQPTAHA